MKKSSNKNILFTPSYAPPELFPRNGEQEIDFETDVWSFGATIYKILFCENYYNYNDLDINTNREIFNYLKKKHTNKFPRKLEEKARTLPVYLQHLAFTLVSKTLIIDKEKRLSVEKLLEIVNDFINNNMTETDRNLKTQVDKLWDNEITQ